MKTETGKKAKASARGLSSKSRFLTQLRLKPGAFLSGSLLSRELGISRVAVWKTVQALCEDGYAIHTTDKGYSLDPANEKDFLYPWEFGEKEALFCHYKNTSSTMDRAREFALRGIGDGTVITAEKQSAGRGRGGRTWVSRQGGLFFTILKRPLSAIADYTQLSLIMQITVARVLTKICGKEAHLRWPNDVYINRQKIAGIITELSGEGDLINWLSGGIGVNVNNPAPSGKTTSCAEITGRPVSRRKVLIGILDEMEKTAKTFTSKAAYSQGNHPLAAEWNSVCDYTGAKAVIFEPEIRGADEKTGKILARGVFQGIDPAGRCILKTEKSNLYFNQGSVSLALLNKD
ncbi:MAG: biotin--[acetyl-CoA-carboxylase] ligase [Treponema sp.]|jgi:BirA family biotin operon repressor/biotin-[acetyl-CoA-carboxylase] ligase|nr:biotin--[acetyl-CoA-carboxylase] ligase [Treponema sp.]